MSLKVKTCACAILVAGMAAVLAFPQHAAAQDGSDADDPPSRVARLSYVQGSISFQPAGESDWASATINRPMTTGDTLWSDEDSRAEVDLGSAAIRLSGDTGFSLLNLDDHTVQVQLSAGTVDIRVRRLARNEVFEVGTANQAFSILRPGEYRMQASEDGSSTTIEVSEGEGEAAGADHTYTLERGQRATLTGSDSLSADVGAIKQGDDFEEWSEMRDAREDRSTSASYVSPDLVGYADLDGNGLWQSDAEYGQTWIPTTVPAGWAPYHYGRWEWVAPWGWTWVDDAAWGYAPFHYGRWAYTQRGWAWVPGPAEVRPVYAPALVEFVGAQNLKINAAGGAAVAWFPLGPREVYVPGYASSREYVNRVNLSNTRVNVTTVTNVYDATIDAARGTQGTHATYVNRAAPGAISAVPEEAFRGAQPVDRVAVRVSDRDLGDAPVILRAQVVPTKSSVLGSAEAKEGVHAPKMMERPVFVRTAPPAAPVAFEEQAGALAAHPGEPLRHGEAEALRPVNAESARSMVRQLPGRQMKAGERPVAVRPEERGASGVQTEAQPKYQPVKEQSGVVQPSNAATAQPTSRPAVRVFEEQGNPEPPAAAHEQNSNRAAKQVSSTAGSQQQRQVRSNPQPLAARESTLASNPVPRQQARSESQAKAASAVQPATAANKDASGAVHGKAVKKIN